jgi:hypothetical protein
MSPVWEYEEIIKIVISFYHRCRLTYTRNYGFMLLYAVLQSCYGNEWTLEIIKLTTAVFNLNYKICYDNMIYANKEMSLSNSYTI